MNAPCCPKTDAVLAWHLDGDLDPDVLDEVLDHSGYGFACGESLHHHLRECPACQTALIRARRLDAALATAAGGDVERHPGQVGIPWPGLVGRWLAAATAASAQPEPAPVAAPADRARAATAPLPVRGGLQVARPLLAAAAAVLVVGGLGSWLASETLAPRTRDAAAAERLRSPQQALLAPHGETTAAPMVPLAAEPAPAPDRVAIATVRRATAPAAPANPQPPVPNARALGRLASDPEQVADERLAAARTLLQLCRPFAPEPARAWHTLVDALAVCGDRSTAELAVHRAMLDLVRDSAAARGLLGQALVARDAPSPALPVDDLAAIAVACRLGTPETDRAVRRLARRHGDTGEVVAAALRCGVRDAGAASLLLDLWDDLGKAGALAADEGPAAWFRDQPGSCYRELADELKRSRVEARRRHCLLALGCAPDLAAAAPLLERLASPHHEEAHAAAFALAHLPREALQALQPLPDSDHAWLLRAALARADAPAARAWIHALGLDAAERELLHRGPLARFPEVASWFRESPGD